MAIKRQLQGLLAVNKTVLKQTQILLVCKERYWALLSSPVF